MNLKANNKEEVDREFGAIRRKVIDKITREIYAQREEILKAFVAKYGFEPDDCMQVTSGNRFFVLKLDHELADSARRSLTEARLHREVTKLTLWQRLCLKAAGWRV